MSASPEIRSSDSGGTRPLRLGTLLWLAAVSGVVSLVPVLRDLIAFAMKGPPPLPISVLLLISGLQTTVLVSVAVLIGVKLGPRVGLEAPYFAGVVDHPFPSFIRNTLPVGLLGGAVGGGFISLFTYFYFPLLPREFIEVASKFTMPWYSRLLYGGITEEILLRFGFMTLIVAAMHRLTGKGFVSPAVYGLGILISALLFGVGHLPTAKALFPPLPGLLVIYVIIANAFFGLIAGFLFWRRGLECAIVAHVSAHLVMMIMENLLPVA